MLVVSPIFDPEQWTLVPGFDFDITYHRARHQGTVRIALIGRSACLRPQTVDELFTALDHARQWSDVGCVLLTGNGPSAKMGWAFAPEAIKEFVGK